MTIVCAELQEDGCWIGCDGLVTRGEGILAHDRRKWTPGPMQSSFARWWIGIAGNQLIESVLASDRVRLEMDKPLDFAAMSRFRKAILAEMKEIEWRPRAESEPPSWNVSLLCADGSELFELSTNLQIVEWPVGQFAAIGAGQWEARGAAFAMTGVLPVERIRTAIAAACELDTGCGGEVFVELIPRKS